MSCLNCAGQVVTGAAVGGERQIIKITREYVRIESNKEGKKV
jgi:hypothetical protein